MTIVAWRMVNDNVEMKPSLHFCQINSFLFLQKRVMSDSSSSEEEEELPRCTEMTITFRVTNTEYYDGCGGTNAYCQGCRDRPKRFYILHLQKGGIGILCRDCMDSRLASDCGDAWTPRDDDY